MADPLKTCRKCGETKPLSGFSRNGPGVWRPECKACRNAAKRARHAERMADPDYRDRKRAAAERHNATEGARQRKREWKDCPEYRAREAAAQGARREAPDFVRHRPPLEVEREQAKARRERNLDHYRQRERERSHRRRAAKRGNGGAGQVTDAEWRAIVSAWDGRCAHCGEPVEAPTQDHVVPLSKGGPHDPLNVVPSCAPCNLAKYDHEPEGARQRLDAGLPAMTPENQHG